MVFQKSLSQADCCRLYAVSCVSGGRASNTWVTYLKDGHNSPKGELIPDMPSTFGCLVKAFARQEGPAAYQLVGEVTAHQGYDG